METLYLDTHIVIWLREKALHKLSQKAVDRIENADMIMVSAMVILELKYLYEIGRIFEEPQRIISDLADMIDLKVDQNSFNDCVKEALHVTWTRDAFDRLIVANAMSAAAPLLTKDQKILENFDNAVF